MATTATQATVQHCVAKCCQEKSEDIGKTPRFSLICPTVFPINILLTKFQSPFAFIIGEERVTTLPGTFFPTWTGDSLIPTTSMLSPWTKLEVKLGAFWISIGHVEDTVAVLKFMPSWTTTFRDGKNDQQRQKEYHNKDFIDFFYNVSLEFLYIPAGHGWSSK